MARASSTPLKLWLESLNLPQYYDNFTRHGIVSNFDWQTITDDLLTEIGVSLPGHRKRLLAHLPLQEEDLYINSDVPFMNTGSIDDLGIGAEGGLPVLPTKTKPQRGSYFYQDISRPIQTESTSMLPNDNFSPKSNRPVPMPRRTKKRNNSTDSNTSTELQSPGDRPRPAPRQSIGIKSPSTYQMVTIKDTCSLESSTDDDHHNRDLDMYTKVVKPKTDKTDKDQKRQNTNEPSGAKSAQSPPLTHLEGRLDIMPNATTGNLAEDYENVLYDPQTGSYTVRDTEPCVSENSDLFIDEDDQIDEVSMGKPTACKVSGVPLKDTIKSSPPTPHSTKNDLEEVDDNEQEDLYEPIWEDKREAAPMKATAGISPQQSPSSTLMPFCPSLLKPMQEKKQVLSDGLDGKQSIGSRQTVSGLFDLPPPKFPPPPLPTTVTDPDLLLDFDPLSNSTPSLPPRPTRSYSPYENVNYNMSGGHSMTIPPLDNSEPDVIETSSLLTNKDTKNVDPFQTEDPFSTFEPDSVEFNKDQEESPFSTPKGDPQKFKFVKPKTPEQVKMPPLKPIDTFDNLSNNEGVYELAAPDSPFDPFGLGADYSVGTRTGPSVMDRSLSNNSSESSVRLSEVPPAPLWYEAIDEDTSRMYALATSLGETSDSDTESLSEPPDGDSGAEGTQGHTERQEHPGVTILPTNVLNGRRKERSGYLYKQGGVKNNRGWQRRWMIFDGRDLRYYSNERSQVSKRVVPLTCMRTVHQDCKEPIPSEEKFSDRLLAVEVVSSMWRTSDLLLHIPGTNAKQYKFKLECTNRTFLFASESLDDCNLWTSTLMEAILTFQPKEEDIKPGGRMAHPVIKGWIKLNRKRFKYFFALKDLCLAFYASIEDFNLGSPLHEIYMKLSSVKMVDCTRIILNTNYDKFQLDFESGEDAKNWETALIDAIEQAHSNDEVWLKVKENPENTYCADCYAKDANWSSVNLGIVLCQKCAGIHRSFERKVSTIASLKMEIKIWTPTLIEMVKAIGNKNANNFWAKHLSPEEQIDYDTPAEKRKAFIMKKYKDKDFCDIHPLAADQIIVNEALLKSAATPDVLQTMQLLFSGADVMYSRPGENLVAHIIAQKAKQNIQMEFLYRNGGNNNGTLTVDDDIFARRVRDGITKDGFLLKTGPSMKDFVRRRFVIEHGQLSYYEDQKPFKLKDNIDHSSIFFIQRTNRTEKYPFCIEISAKRSNSNRVYLLAAESEKDVNDWMCTIAQMCCPVSLIDKVQQRKIYLACYCYLRFGLSSKWQKTWIILEGRSLYIYDKDDSEVEDDSVDLRKVTSLSRIKQSQDGCTACMEQGVLFVISAPERSIYFQADLVKDTERLISVLEPAIKIGGETLEDQCLTADDVPVIVDKCINFIEDNGIDVAGVYREAAQESRIRDLLEHLREDARSVVLHERTSLNEVCNALKRFLRQLKEPLLTTNLYQGWTRFAGLRDHNNKLHGYKHNIQQLPRVNKLTLRRLAIHLDKLSKHSKENLMTLDNIAIAFGSTLMNNSSNGLEANGGANVQLEMRVISEIVMYHVWLFDIEKQEQTVEEKILEAKQKMLDQFKDIESKNIRITDIKLEVFYLDPRGSSQTLNVTMTTLASDLIKELQRVWSLSSEDWYLYEVIGMDNDLERPLHPNTQIWPLIHEWSNWSIDYCSNAKLCLKSNELIEEIEKSFDPSMCLFGQMSFADKKKFIKYTFEFTQSKLSYYKDQKKMGAPLSSWNIEDLLIYKGFDKKRPANRPTIHSFTFVAKSEKVGYRDSKDLQYFGRTVCCSSSVELYRWLAAMLRAQKS